MQKIRVKGRLPIVDQPLGGDGKETVRIQLRRIGARRLDVTSSRETESLPRPRSEKVLAAHARKRTFDPRVAVRDLCCESPRISLPHSLERGRVRHQIASNLMPCASGNAFE